MRKMQHEGHSCGGGEGGGGEGGRGKKQSIKTHTKNYTKELRRN